jgi:hypothetical protein
MRTIQKQIFQLIKGVQTKRVPIGAKLLFVAIVRGQVCAWFEVNAEATLLDRFFHIVGTGWEIPPRAQHRGSLIDDPYVWHLYEDV